MELGIGLDHNQPDQDEVAMQRRRKRLALNRWQLARMLLANPVLAKFRKHRLTAAALEEDADVNAMLELTRSVSAQWGRLGDGARFVGAKVGRECGKWGESPVGRTVNGAVGVAAGK
eukprot:1239915-Prymnesium_polylepis.1